MAQQPLEPAPGDRRQLPDREHTHLRQPHLSDRAHAPHQIDRQVVKELELGCGIDDDQPVGLGYLRGYLGEVLGARHSHGDRKSQLLPYSAPNGFRNLRWWTKETFTPSDIGERLVNGEPLDEGREIAHHLNGGVAQPFVLLEVAIDETQLRTELARLSSRHSTPDTESLALVGSGH